MDSVQPQVDLPDQDDRVGNLEIKRAKLRA
jgi:hypothetical protein